MKILKIILAVLLLGWLVRSDQLRIDRLSAALFTPGHAGVAVMLLLHYRARIQRWLVVLWMQGIPFSFGTGMRLFFIGQFFSITSMGSLGGEVVRGYYVTRHPDGAGLAGVSTVLADRLLGTFTYLAMGGGACLVLLVARNAPVELVRLEGVILFLTGGLALFLLLVLSEWGERRLLGFLPAGWCDRLRGILRAYRSGEGLLLRAVLFSVVTNLMNMFAFLMAARTLEFAVGWGEMFMLVPLVVMVNSLPLPLGGLGVGEVTAQFLLTQVGVDNGALMMLLVRVTQWMLVLPLGLTFYLTEGGRREQEE